MKQELVLLGIPEIAIQVSGIPLKRGFYATKASSLLYDRYKLSPDSPVVLIMAGAQGVVPNLFQICSQLLLDDNIQIALVCGRNLLMKDAIEQQFQNREGASRLQVYGYLESIHELMAISDCLVTKPGGVTLSEGIAAGLPIFIYKPVPGQEKQNALYLASKGAAVISYEARELTASILKLMRDPLLLTVSKLSTKQLQVKHAAAEAIVFDMLSNLRIMENTATL